MTDCPGLAPGGTLKQASHACSGERPGSSPLAAGPLALPLHLPGSGVGAPAWCFHVHPKKATWELKSQHGQASGSLCLPICTWAVVTSAAPDGRQGDMVPAGAHHMLPRGVSVHKPCSLALNLAVTTSHDHFRGISATGTGELLLWGPLDSRVEAGALHSWRALLWGRAFGSCFPRAAASCTE